MDTCSSSKTRQPPINITRQYWPCLTPLTLSCLPHSRRTRREELIRKEAPFPPPRRTTREGPTMKEHSTLRYATPPLPISHPLKVEWQRVTVVGITINGRLSSWELWLDLPQKLRHDSPRFWRQTADPPGCTGRWKYSSHSSIYLHLDSDTILFWKIHVLCFTGGLTDSVIDFLKISLLKNMRQKCVLGTGLLHRSQTQGS